MIKRTILIEISLRKIVQINSGGHDRTGLSTRFDVNSLFSSFLFDEEVTSSSLGRNELRT